MTIGNFIVTLIEFVGIVILFSRFGSLQGWRLEEVALFYGLVNVGWAITEALGRGFDHFNLQVIHGEFDRTLLRPRSTALQVLAHDFLLFRAGRLIQGLAILTWASVSIGIAWNVAKVMLLLVSVAGNVCVFTGLLILQATMCFWSTQSLEVMNSFAGIFVFIIPLACVNYFPALAIMEKSDPLNTPVWFQWTSPLIGLIFLWVSLKVWKSGVRHYHSTGS
jgi:ABC-2 type transport system permease protein